MLRRRSIHRTYVCASRVEQYSHNREHGVVLIVGQARGDKAE